MGIDPCSISEIDRTEYKKNAEGGIRTRDLSVASPESYRYATKDFDRYREYRPSCTSPQPIELNCLGVLAIRPDVGGSKISAFEC